MQISNRLKIVIAAAFIAVVIAVIAWLVYYFFFMFSVVSVRPNQNQVSTLAPVIVLSTNRDLVDQPIEFSDGESGIVASVETYKKDLVINLYQNLESNKEYKITLKNIQSQDGYTIDLYTYTFTPVNNPDLLTDEDRDIILDRQEKAKPAIMADPVYMATPFQSDSYVVKSSLNATPDGKGEVSVKATIYLTRLEASTTSNRNSAINKYKKQIIDRLKDIDGFSEEKYPITFTIQDP